MDFLRSDCTFLKGPARVDIKGCSQNPQWFHGTPDGPVRGWLESGIDSAGILRTILICSKNVIHWYEWVHEWMNEWMNEWINQSINHSIIQWINQLYIMFCTWEHEYPSPSIIASRWKPFWFQFAVIWNQCPPHRIDSIPLSLCSQSPKF